MEEVGGIRKNQSVLSKLYEGLTADTVYYELDQIKKMTVLDAKRLDYKEMSDKELKKNQDKTYSFKFMETPSDKEAARKALDERMKRVKSKIDCMRSFANIGSLKNRQRLMSGSLKRSDSHQYSNQSSSKLNQLNRTIVGPKQNDASFKRQSQRPSVIAAQPKVKENDQTSN